MTRHEAYEYWLMRYNKAKDYNDPHWDAEERAAHIRWVAAMEQAMEALKDASVSDFNKPMLDFNKIRRMFVDYAQCEECTNPYAWGHICGKCGACGRKFDDKGVLIVDE